MASVVGAVAFRTKVLTVSSSVVAITDAGWSWTAGDVDAADSAVIGVHGAGVTMTWDGTTPTATTGVPLAAGATCVMSGNGNVRNVKLIRSGASDATVSITLEKY